MGLIGDLAHRLFVKKKLEDIFNFRYEILDKMFNLPKK